VINSPLRGMLLDNAATQIFFANPQATREDYIEGFHVTEAEFDIISTNAPESRLFLVKHDHESTLCRLNLRNMPDVLAVLSGNEKTIRILDSIRQDVGDDPQVWLPAFHERRQENHHA